MSSSSAATNLSETAFRESVDLSTEIGAVRTKIDCFTEKHGPVSILKPQMADLFHNADRCIDAWHAYLNVERPHGDGCLRAAFTTVTGFTKHFEDLCEVGERVHQKCPDYLTADILGALTRTFERLEDIQESLAILIHDDARTELQSILVEAGIDGRVLDHKDASASRAHSD